MWKEWFHDIKSRGCWALMFQNIVINWYLNILVSENILHTDISSLKACILVFNISTDCILILSLFLYSWGQLKHGFERETLLGTRTIVYFLCLLQSLYKSPALGYNFRIFIRHMEKDIIQMGYSRVVVSLKEKKSNFWLKQSPFLPQLLYLASINSQLLKTVKRPPAMPGDLGLIHGWEDPLEEGMAVHSSIVVWRIPWTEEPGGLQSMGSQGVGHDWVTNSLSYISCLFIWLHPGHSCDMWDLVP